MTNHHTNRPLRTVALLLAAPALLLAGACQSVPTDRDTYDTPQAAVEATIAAMRSDDIERMHAIFGPEVVDLMDSGDEVHDRERRRDFVALYDEAHSLEKEQADFYVLHIGKIESPFAIPLVETGGKWHWDTEEGREEIIDRRIGRNELDVIQVCQAIVDAQMEYAEVDRDGDGVNAYATRFRSSPGKKDGLYWPTAEGEEQSPLGEFIVAAEAEGYEGRGARRLPRLHLQDPVRPGRRRARRRVQLHPRRQDDRRLRDSRVPRRVRRLRDHVLPGEPRRRGVRERPRGEDPRDREGGVPLRPGRLGEVGPRSRVM